MKTITKFICESQLKYCIQWIDNENMTGRISTNNYEEDLDERVIGNYKYYEVMLYSSSNWSEPDGLVEWSGKGGYWANVYEYSSHPENAPKGATIMKGSKLDKIKKCKK